MTKLEAWKTWSASAGAPGTEFTLEKSSHGKAFSYAWDAALAQPDTEMPKKILGPNLEQVLNAAGFYKRQPLTEDEISEIAMSCSFVSESDTYFARAIEKAHGIE